MKNELDLAVLIIAYRRKIEINQILQICKENDVRRIYIALDGPKSRNHEGFNDNLEIRQSIGNFQKSFSGKVITLFRDQNIGCAASCLSACDWVFEHERYAIILEDDCIPSHDFFTFARSSIEVLDENRNVWLACGTQFAPNSGWPDSWVLCKYALIWGWVTSQENWREISQAIRDGNQLKKKNIASWERTYWNQGSRRAYSGWKDVWDTILLQQMLANEKYSILPTESLVSNVGSDSLATHTLQESPWLHREIGGFIPPKSVPEISEAIDFWLRRNFYRISLRHLLTTQITHMKDKLNIARIPLRPLLDRWDFADFDRRI